MGVEPGAQLFDWREPKRGEKAVSRYIATSACIRSRTCRSSRGNDWVAGAPPFNF